MWSRRIIISRIRNVLTIVHFAQEAKTSGSLRVHKYLIPQDQSRIWIIRVLLYLGYLRIQPVNCNTNMMHDAVAVEDTMLHNR
jgi:hypothetical protein